MSTGEAPVRPRRTRGPSSPPKTPSKTAAKKAVKKAPASATARAPRARPSGLVVAVTGAARGVGESLVRRLTVSASVKKVVAIDTIRGDVPQATWRLVDVKDPVLAERLSGVDVVVHLAPDTGADADRPERHASNTRGTATVLTAAAAAGVPHAVLVTSAMVYGARADNPLPLSEDAELRATADSPLLADLLEMERLAARAPRSHRGLRVSVLRPATVVGPGIDTVLTRHFEAPRLLAVKGSRMRWQFCHVDDLVSALEIVATGAEDDASTAGFDAAVVASDGWLEQDDIERITGKRHIELPASLAFGTAERLHRLGVTPASSGDLRFLVHPWVVDARRLAAKGWRPRVDNESALRAALAESSGRLAIGSDVATRLAPPAPRSERPSRWWAPPRSFVAHAGVVVAEPGGEQVTGASGGGSGDVRLADIRDQPLSVDEVLGAVADPAAGGTAVFVGTVREEDGGRPVTSLAYEAHPDAAAVMRLVAAAIAERPGVVAVAGVHRVGLLAIGDLAVVVAVSCGHRHDALAAAKELIDDVKTRVPIWKRQTFGDGEVEWVGINSQNGNAD